MSRRALKIIKNKYAGAAADMLLSATTLALKVMKIHFIGIGGIGISALARYFLAEGNEVSGSDCAESSILNELKIAGAKIFIGHQKENIKEPDLVVFSAAVPDDNPELIEARRLGIKCQKYAEALGDLTKNMFTIAVSGMHGKSTTTAMIGLMMEKVGLDPTVILGTKVREWDNSNFRLGRNKYLVIEADEYDRSLLNYWPKILVLLNIEEEHLDTYAGGLPDIMKTFEEYVSHLSNDGTLIYNGENNNTVRIAQGAEGRAQNYALKSETENLKLKVPGRHNISNANAALAVAGVLGIDEKIAVEALNEFSGTWRRMEYKGDINGAKIYDDYGHHPTEIKATLEGARELLDISHKPDAKLWCVFQPHQYQRTQKLFDQFLGAFDAADEVIILPIYSVAGREKDDIKRKVSSDKLATSIREVRSKPGDIIYLESFNQAAAHLRQKLKSGDICIIMGAGDIYQLTEKII